MLVECASMLREDAAETNRKLLVALLLISSVVVFQASLRAADLPPTCSFFFLCAKRRRIIIIRAVYYRVFRTRTLQAPPLEGCRAALERWQPLEALMRLVAFSDAPSVGDKDSADLEGVLGAMPALLWAFEGLFALRPQVSLSLSLALALALALALSLSLSVEETTKRETRGADARLARARARARERSSWKTDSRVVSKLGEGEGSVPAPCDSLDVGFSLVFESVS